MRHGSLFSGYLGLDMAVEEFFGDSLAWVSDIDLGACRILAHRTDAPNLGDITTINWALVEPVDILTGGWPCQPFSLAGKRKGAEDERALWPYVADAVRALRPRIVVLENVAAVAAVGELARAVGDLSSLGYDARWCCVRASDVGAPHRRERIFVVAADAGGDRWVGWENQNGRTAGRGALSATDASRLGWDGRARQLGQGRWQQSADGSGAPPDTDVAGLEGRRTQSERRDQWPAGPRGMESTPDTSGDGRHEGWPEPAGQLGRPDAAECSESPNGNGRPPERMMGYLEGADTAEGRPNQDLRDVRADIHPQEIQRPARGSDPLPVPPQLLAELRQHQDRSGEGHPALASSQVQGESLQRVRDDGGSARSPQRPGRVEQPPWQSADALLVLSSEAALARGQAEAHGRCGQGCSYGCSAWGQYAPAIHRWAVLLGRIAPEPTERTPKGSRRLSARAVEFMMGLPAGWVTDVPGLTRNQQLKALGNGVVPQQALAALHLMAGLEVAA